MVEMKKQVDGPMAQLIRDLDARGLLDTTLVVVATEFGRTIANQPKAGVEPIGFAEQQSGDDLVIESEKMYGFHGHFSSANTLLCSSAAASSRGLVYGRTADRHPMMPVENPVSLTDVHATHLSRARHRPRHRLPHRRPRPFTSPKTARESRLRHC